MCIDYNETDAKIATEYRVYKTDLSQRILSIILSNCELPLWLISIKWSGCRTSQNTDHIEKTVHWSKIWFMDTGHGSQHLFKDNLCQNSANEENTAGCILQIIH